MLTSLEINHFKSWCATGPLRLAPITALFGSNSSGKTSLLQLLLMLKQTTESSDRFQVLDLGDEHSMVELGVLPDLLHRHDPALPLTWRIAWQLPQPLQIENPAQPGAMLFAGNTLTFATQITWSENGASSPASPFAVAQGRASVATLAYQFAGHEFGMRQKSSNPSEYDLYSTPTGFKFIRTRGRAWSLPAPVKCYGFPDQTRAYYQNAGFLADFELELEQLLQRVFYLGPLRDYPRRQYTWAGAQPADMGRRGERVIDALLAGREAGATIAYGPQQERVTLEARVALWLKELGLIEHFEVRLIAPGSKLYQVWIQRSAQAAEVLITDVGFGVSQILPVITLCYHAPAGSTIILEQPEIHLHPRVQAGLADVFIDAMKTRNIQIILESHSEHLLRRLQRRIAEEQLHADQAALYFCRTDQQGTAQLQTLELDPFGNITNWPKDFFGDEFGEIAAMQEAALKRRMGGV
ncbi:AAA family ATPase [Candidatus Viridilinea mediisalina]|uniref:DUF3696 domain-containing protein n=1 Tax=Candidatus Viridilinea mediisalina TaxID=2024553 RepID=A0A2A6RKR1_9CHLR|nr:DUF3696 domain-containing protein [Candidatus Viridilinea mediisalina]PDW03440.1 hypothetical protein CJ255_08915 [Candidatus Viridilinea mediisalina]